MATIEKACLYGLTADFETAGELYDAVKKAKEAGYRNIEAYSPYEVEGLSDLLGHKTNWLAWAVLLALFVGAGLGWFMQYYTDVLVYVVPIAGRPDYSWPSFTVISYEAGILFAGFTILGGLLFKAGLPLPYHPIFNAPNIELASRSHFFICIKATDRQFNVTQTIEFLEGIGASKVSEVPC